MLLLFTILLIFILLSRVVETSFKIPTTLTLIVLSFLLSLFLPSILNMYHCYEYNNDENILENISENYNQTISQLLEIVSILQKYDIKYEVLKDNSIRLV